MSSSMVFELEVIGGARALVEACSAILRPSPELPRKRNSLVEESLGSRERSQARATAHLAMLAEQLSYLAAPRDAVSSRVRFSRG